jgi:tetratricopeptide (TPR) repeat protein
MGSKLAILAAELILATMTLVARDAAADNATKARALFKQGVDEYKAENYDAAAATLARSYELDAKPDALFALAQAERLGGHCDKAIVHYKQLLASTPDTPIAKAVQTNLSLCPEDEPAPPPVTPAVVEPTPAPAPVTKTVVREVSRSDTPATVLFAGGMLGLGVGAGLFIASNGASDDADHARTLDDHEKFSDRAAAERVGSYVAIGAGAAMICVAVYRWMSGGDRSTTEVAVVPSTTGAMMSFSSRW